MKKENILDPTNEKELEKFNPLDRIQILENYKKELINPTEKYVVMYTCDHDKVDDYCTLKFETDLKNCVLYLPTMSPTKRSRNIITNAVFYAKELGAEEVMVSINSDDLKTKKLLVDNEEYSIFPMDEEDKNILFIWERQNENINSRVM